MDDIGEWLQRHGLEEHIDLFIEQQVRVSDLLLFTEDSVRELGLPLGPRTRLLAAIESLRSGESAAPAELVHRSVQAATGEAERRQLTVMFCDLVGSTALSERMDPEELREIFAAYQSAATTAIEQYDGYVARYMGDGLLVYFGYPQAHEDDAERAVRAGLGIVDCVGQLEIRDEIELEVRVGIATGLVVAGDIVGEGASEERAVLGDTPNLAARLQAIAPPNGVVIAESTQHLVAGQFVFDSLGKQSLKGISTSVTAYRAVGESEAPSRFEAVAERGLIPLIGRDPEIGLLVDRWARAARREAQLILLSGEAGIGKSRIVRGFRELIRDEPHNRVLYYSSPFHRNSALYPATDQLERALRFARDDSPEKKLDKLVRMLNALGLQAEETVPPLASLLSLPTEGRYAPLDLAPVQLKAKILQGLVTVIEAMSVQQPVLMVVEDVHWLDPSTVELLSLVIDRLPSARLLLLITFRPEFEPPWTGHTHATTHALSRLGRMDTAAIVSEVTGGKHLPAEVLNQIIAKTDGVPLYVEELTKTVVESGLMRVEGDGYVLTGPLPPLAIPASLQDSLMARLDRLAAAKDVAQLAAVLGRTFGRELLGVVSPLSESDLDDALGSLVQAELLYRRGIAPEITYEFKHALVQDTAYQSLLKSTRHHYHQRVAQALEEQFPQIVQGEPEVLAHHALQGEVWDKAVTYFHQAGTKAAGRSAYREAVTCFEQALTALTCLPQSHETLDEGIDLRLELRNSLHPLGEHQRLFDHLCEAEPLAERIGDQRRLGWISAYMATYHAMSGDPDHAIQSGERALAIAKTLGEFPLQVGANFRLGLAYLTSDYRRSGEYFKSNVESLQGDLLREHFGEAGPASVLSRIWLVVVLAELGEFVEGAARGEEAVQIATSVDQPWSLIGANYSVGCLHLRKGDLNQAIRVLEHAFQLSQTHPLFWLPWIASTLGYAKALVGRTSEALPLLQDGIEQAASKSQWRFYPLHVAYLSEACRLSDRIDDALRTATQALDSARDYKARGQEAWAHWNLGELVLHHNPPNAEKAEDSYHRALMLADELGMRPLVAHCHVGLGRLYRREGKRQNTDEHLARAIAIYRDTGMSFWQEQLNDRFGI
jgi:class 3 adenylate cyclase/tetratricopeptide (TPR) repeat protein